METTPTDTIGWYNANAEAYAAKGRGFIDYDQIESFLALLPPHGKILDVGCGSGKDMALFSKKGMNVYGLDPSEGLLEVGKRDHPDLQFVLGSMTNIPFPDRSFDGLWVHASLLHLELEDDVRKAFSEFHRVLSDNGILHLMVKSRMDQEPALRITDQDSGHPRVYRFFTKEEMGNLLSEHGFEATSWEEYSESDKWTNGRDDDHRIRVLAKKRERS